MTVTANQGISVTPEALAEKGAEIDSIDEWLDAVSGSKAAGKRAIKNALVREFEGGEVVDAIVKQILDYLNEQDADDELQAAFYFDLNSKLDAAIGDDADEFVSQRQKEEEEKQQEVEASEDEVRAKLEVRKQLVKEFQALKGILEMYGQADEIATIGDYQQRRGALPGQKRKPRKINRMNYQIDGEPLDEDKNTLAGVASTLGVKVRALKAHLEENGVDLKDPSDFEVEYFNKTITATLPEDLQDEEDDEEESDEDE